MGCGDDVVAAYDEANDLHTAQFSYFYHRPILKHKKKIFSGYINTHKSVFVILLICNLSFSRSATLLQ